MWRVIVAKYFVGSLGVTAEAAAAIAAVETDAALRVKSAETDAAAARQMAREDIARGDADAAEEIAGVKAAAADEIERARRDAAAAIAKAERSAEGQVAKALEEAAAVRRKADEDVAKMREEMEVAIVAVREEAARNATEDQARAAAALKYVRDESEVHAKRIAQVLKEEKEDFKAEIHRVEAGLTHQLIEQKYLNEEITQYYERHVQFIFNEYNDNKCYEEA